MSVSFDSYKIFYYVAKHGNITAAAKALYLSQPTVSQCILHMEHELCCRLFVRSKKGVRLTPEGELLFRHVETACTQLWEAEDKINAAVHLHDGIIRIGATETTLHHYLLPYLHRFKETYPDIRLKISNNNTPATLKALDTGRIDFAIIVASASALPSCTLYPLADFQDIVIAGNKYSELGSRTLSLKELCSWPLICMESGTVTRQFLDNFFLSHGLTLSPDIELATIDLITPMVLNNLGIGFVPVDFASRKLKQGKIFQIALSEKLPQRQICLALSEDHPLSSAATQFTAMLCDNCSV